jgi:hypothetical protein
MSLSLIVIMIKKAISQKKPVRTKEAVPYTIREK